MEGLQFLLIDGIGLFLRWLHVIAAIAWVGASFYFIWVENALVRGGVQRDSAIAGHLWAIHGGGFYYLEKYKSAPPSLPPVLHWFKWEAYTTWLSGMGLMVVVYYINADTWLLAPNSDFSAAAAVGFSLAFLGLGFAVYVALCRTPLIDKPLVLGAVGLVIVVGAAHFLPALFAPRAVFMHIGALLGTVMAGNVLMVIIPAQKRMVAAAEAGQSFDSALGRYAGLRSLHNNYLTLPVVFFMISGHSPVFYNHSLSPAVVFFVFLAGIAIRHYFNLHARGLSQPRWLLIGGVLALMLPLLSVPPEVELSSVNSFTEVRAVIGKHCVQCHSNNNTHKVFRAPPAGFTLDSDDKIRAAAAVIYQRVVIDRSMPFNNETGMTDSERAQLAAWVKSTAEKK